ncbi:MAG: guanylate kinase [Lachnospiraceae bacterium]|jgi:guanylate kinase|nr:guanylate kinase [Lachnospiraceae bacterium]MBQ1607471.1 guanylate kinase [Lachnospiraceae bacterium]MBQ1641402.1 guanylate kinase [Lachnospiraceae bacterium]MBQ1721670.1 guanylate kinase [Lachnospiraceae bacterium]MBQ2317148.1 guanylate kinase [Lachnospiraceae bacterium]
MGTIYCVIGKSSTGKDSIYKRLLQREDLQLKKIVPYTTRPIREKEVEGVEYHFVTEEKRLELEAAGKIIEGRSYDTIYGRWDYFTVDDGQIDLAGGDYLLIGTLETYGKLKEYYKNGQIVPIYIEVEDGERLERALRRERKQPEPKYEEMCRRFLADSRDFSKEKLEEYGVTKVFDNGDDIEKTVEAIAAYIKER